MASGLPSEDCPRGVLEGSVLAGWGGHSVATLPPGRSALGLLCPSSLALARAIYTHLASTARPSPAA